MPRYTIDLSWRTRMRNEPAGLPLSDPPDGAIVRRAEGRLLQGKHAMPPAAQTQSSTRKAVSTLQP